MYSEGERPFPDLVFLAYTVSWTSMYHQSELAGFLQTIAEMEGWNSVLVHDLEMIVVVPLDYRVFHVLVLRTDKLLLLSVRKNQLSLFSIFKIKATFWSSKKREKEINIQGNEPWRPVVVWWFSFDAWSVEDWSWGYTLPHDGAFLLIWRIVSS